MIQEVSNPKQTAWLLGADEYAGIAETAFEWNAWEKLCLDCAKQEGDEEWSMQIAEFWDDHFPVALSVASGYAYCALRKADLMIVHGAEPDFEEVTVFAENIFAFLNKLLVEQF